MDPALQGYVDAIAPTTRPLLDRVDALVRADFPDVRTVLSYKMPTYVVERRRLHVGAWKHGLSFYGWGDCQDGGFPARHPELSWGRGALFFAPAAAAKMSDEELGNPFVGASGDTGVSS